ncbi:MAG: glutathione S-transferase family protein [Hyphomicrobiaceae bacterium]|nr:MAG: glutathione S-transferase family protein [Hyphomicrobiaceae bacterium]
MRVYGDPGSGNCHKVRWTADYLGLPYTWVPIDINRGESRTPAYLAKFPQGQVPAIELDDGRCLSQSNAIIRYLARNSPLLPEDAFAQAKVDEWLFWEQYSHEPYVATTRYQVVYLRRSLAEREAWRVERGEKALDFLEAQLVGRDYLTGSEFSLADIALLAYTRLAPEGGFDLEKRPHVSNWIGRCESALGLRAHKDC